MEFLTAYYGLDWLSAIVGLVGLYFVTEDNLFGFLLTALSVSLAAAVAIMAGQYGFLLANVATFTLAVRGYYKWHRRKQATIQSTQT